jgi:hypothetical protein
MVVVSRLTSGYYLFMINRSSRNPYIYDCPATYKITVQGRIDPTWSDRLEGMAIRQVTVEENRPVTTLEGKLSDQAALAGVLNTLYELHLTLFLVERLNDG